MDRFGKFWKPETMVFTNDHWRGSSIFQSKSTRQSREKIKCSAWGSHLEFHLRKRRHGCWDKAKQKDKASDDDDDGLPNLNFDHRTLVIRERSSMQQGLIYPLSTDHRFWCDQTRFERYSVWTNSMWNVCNRTRFERYSVWTNSMWNVCAWCARHGIQ